MPYTPPAGNDVDLIFTDAASPPAGNDVTLDFSPNAPDQITLYTQLDDVAALIELLSGVSMTVSATLDDTAGALELVWDASVYRGIAANRKLSYIENETPCDRHLLDRFDQAGRLPAVLVQAWQTAQPLTEMRPAGWAEVPKRRGQRMIGWDKIPAQSHESSSTYQASPRKALDETARWQIAGELAGERLSGYTSPPPQHRHIRVPLDAAARLLFERWSGFGVASPAFRDDFIVPWQTGNPHSWIWGGWVYPPPVLPPPVPRSPNLTFYQTLEDYTGGAILEFNRPCWAWPLSGKGRKFFQGVSIVIHNIHVVRLPDLVNVPALSASLQFDIDSWAWGVSINLQTPAAIALLEPVAGEPRQVRIELDGVTLTALIESWSENRQFGETTYTATGRSVLALFAQPYAPIRSYLETSQKTAAQLIDLELLNTGWTASYHADLLQLLTTDWLVPAGAWSYQNKSPVDAIVQIAQAIGARAFADRNAALVHIVPRYPVSPWNWSTATPDNTIPIGLVRSISTQLTPQPDYNHVYVSGQTQGVLVSATRQGTAGDKPAPMATDPLMTYVNAGRERARTILANTGRQARVTLDLPLNVTTGLIEPGQLVEVSDSVPWRGLVTGVNVNAAHGAISQQVEIERHYS